MKKRYFFLLLLAATLVYVLAFPRPLTREWVWTPRWNTSLAGGYIAAESEEPEEELFPFLMETAPGEKILGYVSASGDLIYAEAVYYNAAVHPRGFVNYGAAGGNLVFQNPRGQISHAAATQGYPLLIEDWFLVVSRDRKGISRWSWGGEKLWERHFASLITDLDVRPQGLLLGFLNGDAVLMDAHGKVVFSEPHRGEVIYGTALAALGELFGLVLGLEPQRLAVYSYSDGFASLLWEQELAEPYRSPRELFFSQDDRLLGLETPEGAEIWDARGWKLKSQDLPAPLGKMLLSGYDEPVLFWAWGRDVREISVTDPHGARSERIPLAPGAELIHWDSRRLIISQNGQIFRLDRELL